MMSITQKSTESADGKQPLYVVKIGGNVIDNSAQLVRFLQILTQIEKPCVLIHGGGKIATKIAQDLGVTSHYVNGRRITDDATIDIVTMVYGGLVNKKMVAQLQAMGRNAIGLTGADANVIPALKRPVKEIDFGWVGDVDTAQINRSFMVNILEQQILPVFAPLTHDRQGHILNTNADTIAASLSIALSSVYHVRLIYCFEKKGVLEHIEDEDSVIRSINRSNYQRLLDENKLFEGIIPKVESAFAAINAGVEEVLIGAADDLLQNITNNHVGTLITQ